MSNENEGRIYEFPEKNDNAKEENATPKKEGGFFRSRKGKIFIAAAVIILLAVLLLAFYIIGNFGKDKVNNNPSSETIQYATSFSDAEFVILGDSIIIGTENAVTCLSTDGIWKWSHEESYGDISMNVCGKYAVMTEQGKNLLIFFSENGYEKRESLPGNILNVSCSGSNMLVIFKYDNGEYGASFYDTQESEMLKFTRRYASAYLISGTVSKSGKFACVSGAGKESAGVASVLSFVKEKDGEAYATVVEDEVLYPLITAPGDGVFAANSDTLKFVKRMPSATTESDKIKILWERNGASDKIISMAAANRTTAVVRRSTSAVKDSIFAVYGLTGELIDEKHIGTDAEGIISGYGRYAVYSDDCVSLFDENGKNIGNYEGAALIKSIRFLNSDVVVIMTDAGLVKIDFGM